MPASKKSGLSEVLIVGAGPTGLIMAIELARHNIPFRIVDKATQPFETSRALALQSRTLEILYGMDILGKVLAKKQAVAFLSGYIHDRPRMLLNFMKGSKSPYPYICVLSQAETEQILTEHLQALGHKVERSTSVEQLVQRIHACRCKGRLETTFSGRSTILETRRRIGGNSYDRRIDQACDYG